jgi:hypothetical protein
VTGFLDGPYAGPLIRPTLGIWPEAATSLSWHLEPRRLDAVGTRGEPKGRQAVTRTTAAKYRRLAQGCLELARSASTEEARLTLIGMASRWFQLAEAQADESVLITGAVPINPRRVPSAGRRAATAAGPAKGRGQGRMNVCPSRPTHVVSAISGEGLYRRALSLVRVPVVTDGDFPFPPIT